MAAGAADVVTAAVIVGADHRREALLGRCAGKKRRDPNRNFKCASSRRGHNFR